MVPWIVGVAVFAWAMGARSEAATSYDAAGQDPALVALGHELFTSTTAWGQQPTLGPELSGQRLACSSCHSGPGYTDGKTHLISPVGSQPAARRQTPHLFGLADTAPYSWDGRNATLQAQLKGAIVSPLELNAARPPTAHELDALAAYLLTITPPKAQPGVDYDPVKAARGDKLFHELRPVTDPGGEFNPHASAACSTCHEGDLLTDKKPHRIWPTPYGDPADIGEVNQDGHTIGFDTPALIGVRFTAPYFHQGAAGTGEDTVGKPGDPASARQALRTILLPYYNARFQLNFTDADLDDLTEFLLSL
ncbi:MAG TPA: cytochrome c peroxidase [Acidimicrobiia bacterium]|nr:cytochrome c peroxidase [Acidimicrobiia bacterium]